MPSVADARGLFDVADRRSRTMHDVDIFWDVSNRPAFIEVLQFTGMRLNEIAPHHVRCSTPFSLGTIALEISNTSDVVVLQHRGSPCGIIIGRPRSDHANLGPGFLWVRSFTPLIDRPT
jgi:hypothetical protein